MTAAGQSLPSAPEREGPGIRYGTGAGRWVLAATALGSGMAFLDGTVINVALPSIGRELSAGFSGLQWTLDAYLLTLGSLLLLGGSLGDLYGRRRLFVTGLVAFTVASGLCGAAPSIGTLIAARAVQGVGAALLIPSSLALVSSVFHPDDRGRAIGAWSGLSGVSTAVGPFLGGWLVDAVSWRLVFLLNLPLAAVAVAIAVRHVPETRDPRAGRRPDVAGAVTGALGLGGVVFALIEGPGRGWTEPLVIGIGLAGVLALAGFFAVETRSREPMLPLSIFRNRQFTSANVVTLALYAALSGALFLVVLQLQTVSGYSAVAAGASLLPITLLLLVLSPTAGEVGRRYGPRLPLTVGPLLAGVGLVLFSGIGADAPYLAVVLPGAAVFGLGMATTVAPLVTTVFAAVDSGRAGMASGVNNVVARIAGLLAVALLPLAAGMSSTGLAGAGTGVFRRAMLLAAGLCAAAAGAGWLGVPAAAGTGHASLPPGPDTPCERRA